MLVVVGAVVVVLPAVVLVVLPAVVVVVLPAVVLVVLLLLVVVLIAVVVAAGWQPVAVQPPVVECVAFADAITTAVPWHTVHVVRSGVSPI